MSRFSAESFRRVSFTIQMEPDQAQACSSSYSYLATRYAKVLGELSPEQEQPPSFAEVCPDAKADLEPELAAIAEAIYARWAEIDISGPDGLDPSEIHVLALEPGGSGLYVTNNEDEDWVQIPLVTKLAQALQEHLDLPEIQFEWGSFTPHQANNEFGGGAVRLVPGQKPQVFSTHDWLQDPSSVLEIADLLAAEQAAARAAAQNTTPDAGIEMG